MVFTATDNGILKVLDGQQRLATTIMLFSAIRNWLNAYGDTTNVSKIENYLRDNNEFGAKESPPRLVLNPANNEFFRKYVIDPKPLTDIQYSLQGNSRNNRNRLLLKAVLFVNRFIQKRANQFGDLEKAKDYFISLVAFINETVQIVSFIVAGDDAAYTIFETLNDRGLELKPLDLVKNFLFSRAEAHHEGGLRETEASGLSWKFAGTFPI